MSTRFCTVLIIFTVLIDSSKPIRGIPLLPPIRYPARVARRGLQAEILRELQKEELDELRLQELERELSTALQPHSSGNKRHPAPRGNLILLARKAARGFGR